VPLHRSWGWGSAFPGMTLYPEWAVKGDCQILVSTCPPWHETSLLGVRVV